ncbi:hypothetical protein NDU88_006223 [Pleurodeles waltl]|uniref:Uncharacterized protein n=1 Tax=Pleurodeles waltl TaxID=8319 RepID=A0AAV7UKW8_PLEWA|nr:hypothetical protein NDU88_006223 [Pleurodeles waltl]
MLCGRADPETSCRLHEEIGAHIIQGCRSNMLRKLILRQPGITLHEILILACFHELSTTQADAMAAARGQPSVALGAIKHPVVKEE